jgi:hypothetical protein
MPRFLNINSEVFHIPSVSNISMGTNCFGTHYISIYCHTSKKVTKIYYNSWETCIYDFNRLETAMKEIENLLSKIPLTEPDKVIGQLKKESLELTMKAKEAIDDLHKTAEEVAAIYPNQQITETVNGIAKIKEEITIQIEKEKNN